tara:strand:+ start:1718 stop:2023 length:306 start_codon:yes stop_codon:yes gene_type:complete
MNELSNAVTPTFNKVIKRLSEGDALSIANTHVSNTPNLEGTPAVHTLDPADGTSGIVEYPMRGGGSMVVIVKEGQVIWSGYSKDRISSTANAALMSTGIGK